MSVACRSDSLGTTTTHSYCLWVHVLSAHCDGLVLVASLFQHKSEHAADEGAEVLHVLK
jgi:hypothetical protein